MGLSKKICIPVLFSILFFFSCAGKKDYVTHDVTYGQYLDRYTRTGKYYENMETRLIATATYKDIEFMRVQVKKVGNDLLYDSQKMKIMLINAQRENDVSVNFFIALYTPDDRYADYSKSSELWKFYLKTGDNEPVEASRIKAVSKSNMPKYEPLYPYISNWMKCYEISFKRTNLKIATGSDVLSPPFDLLIAGKIGKLSLLFD